MHAVNPVLRPLGGGLFISYFFEGKGGFEQGGLFDLAKQGAVKLSKTTRR